MTPAAEVAPVLTEEEAETLVALPEALPLSAAEERSLARSAFRAAERTPEYFDHMRAHYREARRTETDIVADIRFLLTDGSVYDSGVARIRNVSPSGALLQRLKLCKNNYPMQRFSVEIVMRGGSYDGIVIHAKPVRFDAENGGLGVKFEDIIVSSEA